MRAIKKVLHELTEIKVDIRGIWKSLTSEAEKKVECKETEILQEKIEGIAIKYVDLVKKQIDDAINNKNEVDFEKINEGIRMINHITGSLLKLSACEKREEKYTGT